MIELVRALLLHLRASEGKEWVDITNMPKAAHMLQVCVCVCVSCVCVFVRVVVLILCFRG